jgi:hypothetical protein
MNSTTSSAPIRKPWVQRGGLRLAQLGASLHIAGGLLDFSMSELQPFHRDFLRVGAEGPSPEVSALLLALFHALGATLVAGGIAMLSLLHLAQHKGERWVYVVVIAVAMCCEGMVGAQMLALGLGFGVIPLVVGLATALGAAMSGLSTAAKSK